MSLDLPPETKKRLEESLQRFCREHLDHDLGVLQCERLLDFMIDAVGAHVYNTAIADAQAWMQSKLLDLEGDLHEKPPAPPAR